MKKIFILLTSIFLLAGCVETVALIGGGAANGKVVQSSINSGISYGIKKKTGKSPLGHALAYGDVKKTKNKKEDPCLSFANKASREICLAVEKRITLTKAKMKESELSDKSQKKFVSSLQSSINQKSKINYLDQ